MRVEHHHYLHADGHDAHLLSLILSKVIKMSQATDELQAAVAAQGTVIGSAVVAIKGFPTVAAEAVRKALEEAGIGQEATDAAVRQTKADVESQTQALTDALVENTGESLPPQA